jgi:hypothetical protein
MIGRGEVAAFLQPGQERGGVWAEAVPVIRKVDRIHPVADRVPLLEQRDHVGKHVGPVAGVAAAQVRDGQIAAALDEQSRDGGVPLPHRVHQWCHAVVVAGVDVGAAVQEVGRRGHVTRPGRRVKIHGSTNSARSTAE